MREQVVRILRSLLTRVCDRITYGARGVSANHANYRAGKLVAAGMLTLVRQKGTMRARARRKKKWRVYCKRECRPRLRPRGGAKRNFAPQQPAGDRKWPCGSEDEFRFACYNVASLFLSITHARLSGGCKSVLNEQRRIESVPQTDTIADRLLQRESDFKI